MLHRLAPLLVLAACATPPGTPGSDGTAASAKDLASEPDALRSLSADPPQEADLPPMAAGRWPLACGATLSLAPGGLLQLETEGDLRQLAGVVLGAPAIAAQGDRVAWSRAPQQPPETVVSVLACQDGAWGAARTLASEGAPDRVALTPDGAWVLWFSGASGVPALWAAPFAGGDPKQLTNRGVSREGASPGHPPAGFVPPPHMGGVSVEALGEGRYLARWQTPDGEHTAELP